MILIINLITHAKHIIIYCIIFLLRLLVDVDYYNYYYLIEKTKTQLHCVLHL